MSFSVRTARIFAVAVTLFTITAPAIAKTSNNPSNARAAAVHWTAQATIAALANENDTGVGWD